MNDLTVGKEGKLIFKFAIPMLLGNVFQQLYSITDSIVVGNFIGKEALAAVGSSFPIIFAMVSLVIGIAIGFTVIISQYFGAKEFEKVKRAIDTMNIFLFVASIVVTIVGLYFCNSIFRLLQLSPEVLPLAESYFKIYLTGTIAMFGFNGVSAILRGLGDSKTPLYFLIISTLLNIILVVLFVVVFHWGVNGSAWATVIAQTITFISTIIYLNKYHKIIKFSFINLVFDRDIFSKTVRIGLPSGLQQTFVALGMMAIFGIVNTFGTDATAAYSIAARIDSFAILPAMNFSMALSAFVGQNIGANRFDRVKDGFIATLKMSSFISIVLSIVIIIFSKQLMGLFTQDMNVIYIGSHYLVIVCSFYTLLTSIFVLSGVMRGAGATLIPMFITLLTLWLIRVPLAFILSKSFGIDGIWWGTPIAWAIGVSLLFIYYVTGKWKNKAVVKHPKTTPDFFEEETGNPQVV